MRRGAGCCSIEREVNPRGAGPYRRQAEGTLSSSFSKGDVRRAGALLRGHHQEVSPELSDAFRVAHEWRASHLAPMRSIRASLSAKARAHDPIAVSAGRLKRMKSIRKKLRREPADMTEIQDLGGCRAVLPNIAACRAVAADFLDSTAHECRRQRDYILRPRMSGYRSHHLVLKFQSDDLALHGRLIEVQLRTQLQHAWATALEAVGLVRGEDLKGGEGDQQWLRFFALMSGEIAQREGCGTPEGVAEDCDERRREIRHLASSLRAVNMLDSYRRAINATSSFSSAGGGGGMFFIRYDPSSQSVEINRSSRTPSDAYQQMERTQKGVETVLVEVDRAADLRAAYPNYYLDVDQFLTTLKDAIWGVPLPSTRDAKDDGPPAPAPSRTVGGWRPDFSWLPTWRQ